eukprot:TRINITY_DN22483_c0_g1_i1.p1 TRINITY_DN22483_c0_g1~~TRINITY_DN22483_c0_g1_i1.p1  ORF type:complete len:103 (-),score=10.83 TRINITY_DN22483_c0_g1_i1:37-345(-)
MISLSVGPREVDTQPMMAERGPPNLYLLPPRPTSFRTLLTRAGIVHVARSRSNKKCLTFYKEGLAKVYCGYVDDEESSCSVADGETTFQTARSLAEDSLVSK